MPQLFRSRSIPLCVVVCLVLLGVGCGKKRIYTEPVPPGAHVPAGAKVPAPAPAPAPTSAKPEPSTTAAKVATAKADAPAKAEPIVAQKLPPVQLGDELPSEVEPLSGKAGILDDELIGFPLANGSSYDADRLVAGHRTLPLGTKVEVTSIATGKRVVVTIADRGPFEETRIIDLSHAAADQLGMKVATQVTLKVVGAELPAAQPETTKTSQGAAPSMLPPKTIQAAPEKTLSPNDKTALGEPFYVQVGAFGDAANAQTILEKLVQDGLPGSRLVSGSEGMTRVQAGPFVDRAAAEQSLSELRADYPASFIVTPD